MKTTPKQKKEAVLDWELCLQLAGNKPDLAKDILTILVKHLPSELAEIKQARDNLPLLLRCVHKLHGAVSYCGVPRLKNTLATFEASLKHEEISQVDLYLSKLEYEVTELIAEAS
jgi:two-component system sensor histidine kinase BarA